MQPYIISAIIIAMAFCFVIKKNTEIKKLQEKLSQLEKENAVLGEKLDSIESEYNELKELKSRYDEGVGKLLESNLTAIPWLSAMMADYLTYDMEMEAIRATKLIPTEQSAFKVNTIREIRKDAGERIAQAKAAIYQLEYLKKLYPQLEEIVGTDYNDLDFSSKMPKYDVPRQLLTKEEWESLDEQGRNQLALDKYCALRKTNKYQASRDYLSAVVYEFEKRGCKADLTCNPLENTIVAYLDGHTIVVQCKYCTDDAHVHENYIFALHRALTENNNADATAVFVTNGRLSDKAKEIAEHFGIKLVENHKAPDFPRIKCVVDTDGKQGYHLPFDYWYDDVKLENEGEFYAFTVAEAEEKGFHRAYKWHGLPQ
ncbi:MAG: restriction endonuclease [Clostridia bacterium]|nr:restriction endonuclease [Clostridia bacterium]